jgi:hypothetical protein
MSSPYPRVSASPLLHIDITRPSPATTRIALAGEVDLTTAPDLLDRLLSVLHTEQPAVLDVDLTDVSFLGCAGVALSPASATPPSGPDASCGSSAPSPSSAWCWISPECSAT